MAVSFVQSTGRFKPDSSIVPGVIVMALALFVGAFLILLNSDAVESYPYFFLLPWLFALAVILIIPSAVLYYQDKFSFANPIIFATWSYFFPAFVIGGFALAAGWSNPYFLLFIQDAQDNLPYTVVLIMLGFAALSVGYFLPIGARIGAFISGYLPNRDYKPSSYLIPGLLLLSLGIMNSILATALGIIGFQKVEEINSYDGLIFLTTLFWMQASFLLWYVIFRLKMNPASVIIALTLIAAALSKALFAGNRGSVIQIFSIITLAYILAGRKFKFRQGLIAGTLLVVFMILGMIYGTTFRNVKGSESAQSLDLYTENVFNTFDQIGRNDNMGLLEFAFANMAERIDVLSTVAVVASNYEQLAPYEESYGLDDNIWKDTTTFFIPRVLWNDKPVASDPRRYSDLYFNYGESSFAITPIGDLLRNFGPIGVPIGMLILGIIMRMIYRALVEDQANIIWRSTLYFMLLTAVSYEGFYGSIIPYLFKVGFIAVVGVLLVNFFAHKITRNDIGSPTTGHVA